jgi:predicted TPR repeat methyltransferase
LNAAACHLKLNDARSALNAAEAVLRVDPDSVKGLYRRGVAWKALGEGGKAAADLSRVLQLDAGNSAAAKELNVVKAEQKRHRLQTSKTYKAMFSAGGGGSGE